MLSYIKNVYAKGIRIADQNPILGATFVSPTHVLMFHAPHCLRQGLVSLSFLMSLFVPPVRGFLGYRTEQWTKVAVKEPWRQEVEQWPPSYKRTV